MQNKNTPSGCLKKTRNKWSYLVVNDLIVFLNCIIYAEHEKEAIAPKFYAENLFWKKLIMKVQHGKSATQKKWNVKKGTTQKKQDENSTIRKKSSMKKVIQKKSAI